jgi:hypothetical protein
MTRESLYLSELRIKKQSFQQPIPVNIGEVVDICCRKKRKQTMIYPNQIDTHNQM